MQLTFIEAIDTEESPAEAFSLEAVKKHIGIEIDNDDEYLTDIIAEIIDEIQTYTGTSFIKSKYKLTLPAFPIERRIDIPIPPLDEIEEFIYFNGQNQETAYEDFVVIDGGNQPSVIVPSTETMLFPRAYYRDDAVQITFITKQNFNPRFSRLVKEMCAFKYTNRNGEAYPQGVYNAMDLITPSIYQYRGVNA